MRIEVVIRYSDGRSERHSLPAKVGDEMEVTTHLDLKLPAFEGKVTGPTLTVRVVK